MVEWLSILLCIWEFPSSSLGPKTNYPSYMFGIFRQSLQTDAGIYGKVAPVPKHHAIKTYELVQVKFHAFLNSALIGREWLISCSGRFTPGEIFPGTRWLRGLVGDQTRWRREISSILLSEIGLHRQSLY
jgi:hypothetical protein